MPNSSPKNKETIARIEKQLQAKLNPSRLSIDDDSWKHVGHPGAAAGGGHFTLWIEADCLEGLSRVKSHQLIYQALGDMIGQEIHALAIRLAAKPNQP